MPETWFHSKWKFSGERDYASKVFHKSKDVDKSNNVLKFYAIKIH